MLNEQHLVVFNLQRHKPGAIIIHVFQLVLIMSSIVWKFFSRSKTSPDQVNCTLCESQLTYKSGSTSSLLRHVTRWHPEELAAKKTQSTSLKSAQQEQPTLQGFIRSNASLASTSQRACDITHHVLKMICVDLQPLSVVEDDGFKGLIKCLDKRYQIPSRTTFRTKVIPRAYEEAKMKLKSMIKDHRCSNNGNNKSISITTDGWTSKTNASFVTYTLHFINSQYEMVSHVLATREMRESHTAMNLRAHLTNILIEWGFIDGDTTTTASIDTDMDVEDDVTEQSDAGDEDETDDEEDSEPEECEDEIQPSHNSIQFPQQIPQAVANNIYITTDNASNISKAVAESEWVHVRCFAHTINLGVQKGLSVLKGTLTHVRKIIKFFKKSPRATTSLQVIVCHCLMNCLMKKIIQSLNLNAVVLLY